MRLLSILLLLLVAGCDSASDKGPGGVTQSEADALNAAAAKTDAGNGVGR